VAAVLDVQLGITARWRGGDLDRVLNQGHAAMHETAIALFGSLNGWQLIPEVSFSIYGERGVLDGLAFHAGSGSAIVVELKTEIADPQALVGSMDRRRRLAKQIAADRGWAAKTVGLWVAVADTRSNRRRLARHVKLLRLAFPADGHALRAWLRDPAGPIAALSFIAQPGSLTNVHARNGRHAFGLPKRVASRPPTSAAPSTMQQA
jgi:hypothetical protein